MIDDVSRGASRLIPVALICCGVYMIYPPAALIVLGAMLLIPAILIRGKN